MIGSNQSELAPDEKPDHVAAFPFYVMNLLGIAGFYYWKDWSVALVAIILYFVRMFFITAFQHRYFSHRSFRIRDGETIRRPVQFLMALCVTSAVQKGPLWWAAWHRHHHRHSDSDEDVHSCKLRGFYWSHVGWILCRKFHTADYKDIKDFARYPELMVLETARGYLLAPVALALACLWYGGVPLLAGGFFTSTFLLYHGTFSINSGAHMFGTQRFATGDESRNCWWLSILTLGEGWHNNHHHEQGFEAQAITRAEKLTDVTHMILTMASWTGLLKLNLRKTSSPT